MANENQNTGPNTQGPNPGQTRQTLSDVQQIKKEQGDLNNTLKDSINILRELDRTYQRIEARLETLNKSSINIKEVNNELYRAKQKDYIVSKQLSDAETKMSDGSKNRIDRYLKSQNLAKSFEEKLIQARQKGDTAGIKAAEQKLNRVLAINERQRLALNIEEAQVIALKEAEKIGKQAVKNAEEKLATEKAIKSEIGYSGAALGLFAKKLGLGNAAYEQMVLKARKLNEEGKKMTFGDKLSALGKAGIGGVKEALGDPLTLIPIIGTAVGGLIKGFMSLVELGLSVQDRTVKFGRALGLSASEAQRVRNQFSQIAFQSNSVLVNTERLLASQEELTGVLGTNNILSSQILETNIQLKELAGLDAETRAEIAKSSIITSQSADSITKSVLAQVVGLKQATGVSFNYQRILKEASSLGGYLGLAFSKYPAQLTKSLLTVKAMGLELKQLDQMADSFLDFESSISKEFEAQLLTGRDINLMKAREAFLNNDLATAASEITRQVGSASDFLKLNRIQAESLAGAFGMSRDQMGEMLKQQELLSRLGAGQNDNAREQLRLGLERYKTHKALAAAVGEEAYQSLINASSQEKIAAFMDKIKQAIADFVANSPLIPLVERAINWLSDRNNIQKIVSYIQDAFALIFDIVGKTAGVIMKIGNFFGAGIDQSLIDIAMSGGASIRAMNLSGTIPESVSTNVANSAVKSTMPSDNMSMAGKPVVNVVLEHKTKLNAITGEETAMLSKQYSYYDARTGQFESMT